LNYNYNDMCEDLWNDKLIIENVILNKVIREFYKHFRDFLK
jgi:hypothetical protein